MTRSEINDLFSDLNMMPVVQEEPNVLILFFPSRISHHSRMVPLHPSHNVVLLLVLLVKGLPHLAKLQFLPGRWLLLQLLLKVSLEVVLGKLLQLLQLSLGEGQDKPPQIKLHLLLLPRLQSLMPWQRRQRRLLLESRVEVALHHLLLLQIHPQASFLTT